MSTSLEHINIHYTPEWFASGFFVYVLTVRHKGQQQYYIGQTGDRNHISSRSPFYRLWGHFNPYNSKKATDAQLFKGILKMLHIDEDSEGRRQKIERAITSGEVSITADYFKIFDVPEDISQEEHTEKRKHVEDIELLMIQSLAPSQLINSKNKIGSNKSVHNAAALATAKHIFHQLNIQPHALPA